MLSRIRKKAPLIECLTNAVTVNDVANTILAAGASPVMGYEESELDELISKASAVLLNIGTLVKSEIRVFDAALDAALKYDKPVVLDPVGAGATTFRTESVLHFLKKGKIAVIRGNASEIRAIYGGSYNTKGVDVADTDIIGEDNVEEFVEIANDVAQKYACVVSMSGAIDVITNGTNAWLCRNGVPEMSRITGTGCSLSGLTATFIAVAEPKEYGVAAAQAAAMMGLAGERARDLVGTKHLASLHIAILNELSAMEHFSPTISRYY